MSHKPPTPPTELPTELVSTLSESDPDRLRHVARYADELAEYKARATRLEGGSDRDETAEQSEDLPEGVPSKAAITIKEINDNRYYYWQWRDGETIKSKYKGPVHSGE